MEYRYEIFHIDGSSNLWADMVSRWASGYKNTLLSIKVLTRSSLNHNNTEKQSKIRTTKRKRKRISNQNSKRKNNIPNSPPSNTELFSVPPINPLDHPEFQWPTIDQLKQEQLQFKHNAPSNFVLNLDGLMVVDGKIWIPEQSHDLQL